MQNAPYFLHFCIYLILFYTRFAIVIFVYMPVSVFYLMVVLNCLSVWCFSDTVWLLHTDFHGNFEVSLSHYMYCFIHACACVRAWGGFLRIAWHLWVDLELSYLYCGVTQLVANYFMILRKVLQFLSYGFYTFFVVAAALG